MSVEQSRSYGKLAIKLARGAALTLLPTMSVCGGDFPPATPQWYSTCGDPVCHGYTAPMGVARCTTETVGATCATAGSKCDPMDSCDALYICATTDPKTQPGGCPISRQKYKTDIQYLDEAGLQKYAGELARVKLATYKYKTGGPLRLGFIIEDHEPSVSIDSEHDLVDLYGYTSMAVAALKLQETKLAALQQQVSELSAQLKAAKSKRKKRVSGAAGRPDLLSQGEKERMTPSAGILESDSRPGRPDNPAIPRGSQPVIPSSQLMVPGNEPELGGSQPEPPGNEPVAPGDEPLPLGNQPGTPADQAVKRQAQGGIWQPASRI